MPSSLISRLLPIRLARGTDSLLGRYLWGAGALVLLLVGTAWYAQHKVGGAASINSLNHSEREALNQGLHLINISLLSTQTSLQRYLVIPDVKLRDEIQFTLSDAIQQSRNFASHPRISASESARLAKLLVDDLQRFSVLLDELMSLRADPQKLFPSVPFMLTKLEPLQREILGELQLSIDEARDNLEDPTQRELHTLFVDLRHHWAQRVSSFRLLISSRIGIFTLSPDAAIQTSATNMDISGEAARAILAKLAAFEDAGKLDLQQAKSLPDIRNYMKEWDQNFKAVLANYRSDNWRLDNQLIKQRVEPLLGTLFGNLRAIEKTLKRYYDNDITATTAVADQLSNSLWLLAFIAVALAAAGTLMFELSIRRPLSRVATALKAEAQGTTTASVPELTTRETRDLGDAFQHMREQVQLRQERLQAILDNTAEGIITFGERGHIEGFNQSAETLFGWGEDEVLGTSITHLISIDNKDRDLLQSFSTELQRLLGQENEVTGLHRDGSAFPMAIKVSSMVLQGKQKYVALVSNISERKAMMEHLRKLAEHDGLTGLYNRSYFQVEIERVVERIRRNEVCDCAMLYIDLDHFKYVNDTMGHAAGDKLLIEVAGILNRRTRKSDLVARLGGDEFVVLLYDTPCERVDTVADSFRRTLADYEFRYEGRGATIGCSVGVAVLEPTVSNFTEVMSRADLACHLAKRRGRNQIHVFEPADAKDVTTMSLDMGWSRRIREAIEKDGFLLAAQPIVNTQNREITTYEILIRLRDENGEIIMPGGFLPTAERFGLSYEIDQWVIMHAIRMLADHHRRLSHCSYTINLSAQSLNSPNLEGLVKQELAATGIDPTALVFEITETAAIADMTTAVVLLEKLRLLGCRTALDDFGSGMSSFAYLQEFPVDIVKIDGRFVRHLATSPVDQVMCRAMNDIAHALGKQTVAEFVENEATFQKLIELGVDYAQGYHLGRPELIVPEIVKSKVARA